MARLTVLKFGGRKKFDNIPSRKLSMVHALCLGEENKFIIQRINSSNPIFKYISNTSNQMKY